MKRYHMHAGKRQNQWNYLHNDEVPKVVNIEVSCISKQNCCNSAQEHTAR